MKQNDRWRLVRRRLFIDQQGRCFWCQTCLTWETATIDHVYGTHHPKRPRPQSGPLVVACQRCNWDRARYDNLFKPCYLGRALTHSDIMDLLQVSPKSVRRMEHKLAIRAKQARLLAYAQNAHSVPAGLAHKHARGG